MASVLVLCLLLAGGVLAWRKRPGADRTGTSSAKPAVSIPSLERYTTALLHLQDGVVVAVEKPAPLKSWLGRELPAPWYKRWRVGVSLALLLMFLLTFCQVTGLADSTRLALTTTLTFFHVQQTDSLQPLPHGFNASRNLVRISQLDPAQYASPQEYNTWAYSACSAAAMTEVFDAYGRHYRITDVLQVEAALGQITPQLGLVAPDGIAITAAHFGFKTDWGENWSLQRLITTANNGYPVIISFPPDRYAGGHLLVVIGGDSTYVYLADSSAWNRRELTYDQFLQWWGGYAALVTPQ
jgi:hypothetical protein